MYFYKDLMVGESIRGKENKICKKLRHGAGMLQVHVITLNQGKDIFDIYHCAYFKQKALRNRPLCVVGLAGSHEEAVLMVTDLIRDIYARIGNTDFKSYFINNIKQ